MSNPEEINPKKPKTPYTLKKVKISLPDANPAPIIVPIITNILLNIHITTLIICYILMINTLLKSKKYNVIIIVVIKEMRNKKNLLIFAVIAILLISIILVITIKKEPQNNENIINIEKLEMEFSSLFNNNENQYVKNLYHIENEKSGQYRITANIPYVNIENEIGNKINKEINDIFTQKLLQVVNKSEKFTVLNMDYTTSTNKNILSLVIRCVVKEGNNSQRTIIKTYNYDIENNKEIEIMEIIPIDKTTEIQNQINQEIEKKIKKEESIIRQGYNVYRRDKQSEIYKLENATEFYIRDNIIYLIYCYGNNNYTSEIDLIINQL